MAALTREQFTTLSHLVHDAESASHQADEAFGGTAFSGHVLIALNDLVEAVAILAAAMYQPPAPAPIAGVLEAPPADRALLESM